MSHETLQFDDDLPLAAPIAPRPRRRRRARHPRFSSSGSYDRSEPGVYSLMRNRRLIMAALRVWELKNGYRNSY